jgi:hypothetical protein
MYIIYRLTSSNVQEFKKYKPALLFVGLVNLFFKHLHERIEYPKSKSSDDSSSMASSNISASAWTECLANYIRHNDVALMEACRRVLKQFEDELIVCEDWIEMFEVTGKSQVNDRSI